MPGCDCDARVSKVANKVCLQRRTQDEHVELDPGHAPLQEALAETHSKHTALEKAQQEAATARVELTAAQLAKAEQLQASAQAAEEERAKAEEERAKAAEQTTGQGPAAVHALQAQLSEFQAQEQEMRSQLSEAQAQLEAMRVQLSESQVQLQAAQAHQSESQAQLQAAQAAQQGAEQRLLAVAPEHGAKVGCRLRKECFLGAWSVRFAGLLFCGLYYPIYPHPCRAVHAKGGEGV